MVNIMKSHSFLSSSSSFLGIVLLCLVVWSAESMGQNQSSLQQVTSQLAVPGIKVQPVVESYALDGDLVKRFAGTDKLVRRRPGTVFVGTTIAQPRFASSTQVKALTDLREAAGRFFSGSNRTQGSVVDLAGLTTFRARTNLPLVTLDLGAGRGVTAGAFPESTGLFLRHVSATPPHPTRVEDSASAVNLALSFIADRSLLSLHDGEGLDVINVKALYAGETDENGGPGEISKVAHHVVFGRTYRGVPIDGGMVLVVLDSDGAASTFCKTWRDIVGENQVRLASESTIRARRDPAKVSFLVERERTCVLTEDPDPSAVHEAAGIGCKFVYSDPSGGAGLSRTVVEWVNAADDASISLKGTRSARHQ
jgi:hypothetical protein